MDDLNLVMTLLACDSERFFDVSKSDSDLFSALYVIMFHSFTKHANISNIYPNYPKLTVLNS